MTLTKFKPKHPGDGEHRPATPPVERPVTVNDDMADLRRIIGYPGGLQSQITREE
jgi:hypothetical protein